MASECNVRDNTSGGSRGGARALTLRPNWGLRFLSNLLCWGPKGWKKYFFETGPPLLYVRVWMTSPPSPPSPLSDPPLNTATATFRLNPHGKRDINLISPSQRFPAILLMLMLMQFYRLVVPSSTWCLASECSGLNSIRWSLLPYYQDHWDKPCSSVWYCYSI